MNQKLQQARTSLNISENELVHSCGDDTSLMSLRQYKSIENGSRVPTLDEKKSILSLLNINRSERSLPHLDVEDVF